jgi:subtilase family serine protease
LGNGGAYDPSYLQSAYNAPSSTGGTGQTVAVVDAYDDPNAESDLGAYRSHFGLSACTTANGCFHKVNQSGGTSYPPTDPTGGWEQETALDIDMVSAMCPNCHILLVEANDNQLSNLEAGVNTAASSGANAISNSYGAPESSAETTDNSNFNHPGVAVTAASGDGGYGTIFPASSQYVIAVGGTTLNQSSNTGTRNATETVWSQGGSGCSPYLSKPSWQKDTGCSKRTEVDVAALADPSTGVWTYNTYALPSGGQPWGILGGTSVATPIIASVYALRGNGSSTNQLASYPYGASSGLNDVTSGSNGTCTPSYLCTARTGYDGPTGLGTPNGTAAFGPPAPSNDFSISANPTSLTAAQGSSANSTISTAVTSGSAQTVNLSVNGVPNGATANFSPTSVTSGSSSTLTVNAGTAAAGTYPLTVTGTGTSATHSTPLSLTVAVTSTSTVPGAPAIGQATAGNASATATFTPPASNGGSAITNYTATATDLTNPARGGQSSNGSGSPITVGGLTNGDTYTLSVTATNSAGTGPASGSSNPVTPAVPTPEVVVASNQFGIANQTDVFSVAGNGAVQVSWVQGGGNWNGPAAISPTGLAPAGAHLAVSNQFGTSNQTDVFVVGSNGAVQVLWVNGGGAWNGPAAISPTGLAPAGAALSASNQFGTSNQTDVFVVGSNGAVQALWIVGGGGWNGPWAISPTGLAPAGAALSASNQFGISNRTDVFLFDSNGSTDVMWVDGGGSWQGPGRI